jgi:hypothetical protein
MSAQVIVNLKIHPFQNELPQTQTAYGELTQKGRLCNEPHQDVQT